jgi:eukaryotic-like serine/threonine-protein kinase
MNPLKRIIHEVHRRSLWQVLGIFLAASWGVIEAVDLLTEQVGLPDWTPTMAVVLLLIGMPVVLATAFVQEGMPGGDGVPRGASATDAESAEAKSAPENLAAGTGSLDRPTTRPSARKRVLTWRNALMGGIAAFALLGFSLIVYFVMWTTGVGPVGNLVAQGVFDDGERIVLANFADATGERLGDVVTEALRVDLTEATVLDLVEEVDVAPVLARMQMEPGSPLTAELAREVAVREGVKAVLDGEVARVGTGYLVTATLRAADSGRSIASFRVTADGPDQIIASIDKLSQDIREKSGESLRSIRAGEPLEDVTTRSLDALRLFTEADELQEEGDDRRAVEALDEAVALDPEFAMAWRKMAVILRNIGIDPTKQRLATTRAFENRARLTERERHLTEANYFSEIESDRSKTIAAYLDVLRIAPDDRAGLNNLANEYMAVEDFDRARELYRRAVDGPGRSNTAYQNLVRVQIGAGDFAGAERVYGEYAAAYPDDANLPEARFWASFVQGDMETARAAAEPLTRDPSLPAFVRASALDRMGHIAYWEGRLDEGRGHLLAAERAGAEVGPAFELVRRQWTAWTEWEVGDPAWAARRVAEDADGDAFWSLDAQARPYFFVGLNLALAGDRARAGRVIDAYTAAVPEAERGAGMRRELARLRVILRVASGDTEGALEEYRDAAERYGCPTCDPNDQAWLAERSGLTEEAIRLHEEVRQGGFTFFELNGPLQLRSVLVLGPLYEEAGDTARAIEAYQRLVDQWAGAEERGLKAVRHAQSRIAALGGG